MIMGKDVIDPAKSPGMAIPPNHCVYNLKVSTSEGSCGLLRPGDRVDVVADVSDANDDNQKQICRGVRIFNFKVSETEMSAIAGLLLTEAQATIVAKAAKGKATGQLRLKLRDGDSLLE